MEGFNSYIKSCKYLTMSLGLWPEQAKLPKTIISTIIWTTITTFLIPELLGFRNNWNSVENIAACLSPFFGNLLGISGYVNAFFNKKKLQVIITKMRNDWLNCESTDEYQIMLNNSLRANNLIRIQLVLYSVATLEYILEPLTPFILNIVKPLNKSRPLKEIVVTDYFVDKSITRNYILISLNEIVIVIVIVLIVVTVDSIFIDFAYHACGQLEVLEYRFKNLINKDDNVDIFEDKDRQRRIKFCIKKHLSIITYVNEFNECFSLAHLFNLGLNMFMMSFTGVQLMMRLDHISECLVLMFYIFGQLYRLFVLTLPSQRLIDRSDALFHSIYDSYWYSLSMKSKKLLVTVMMRCLIPNNYTVGKLYCFSIANFVTVVKTSVSYLTVLLSIRETS